MTSSLEQLNTNEKVDNLTELGERADEAKEDIFNAGVVPVKKSKPNEIQRFDQAPVEKIIPHFEKWVDAEVAYWEIAGKEERGKGHMSNEEELAQMNFEMVSRQIKEGRGGEKQLKQLLGFLGEEQLETTHAKMEKIVNKSSDEKTETVVGVEIRENQEHVNYGEARVGVVNALEKHYLPE